MPWVHFTALVPGEREPSRPQTVYSATSFNGTGVIALFDGPWADIAINAFTSSIGDAPTSEQLKKAYQQAVDATAAEWNRIETTCEDEFDMFGQMAAGGACVFLEADRATSYWLGGNPIIQIRSSAIVSQNTPHTLYHSLLAAGSNRPDDQYYWVQVKSFVHEQEIDSSSWTVLPGDRILILPHYVKPSSLAAIARTGNTRSQTHVQQVAGLVSADCQPLSASVVLSELVR